MIRRTAFILFALLFVGCRAYGSDAKDISLVKSTTNENSEKVYRAVDKSSVTNTKPAAVITKKEIVAVTKKAKVKREDIKQKGPKATLTRTIRYTSKEDIKDTKQIPNASDNVQTAIKKTINADIKPTTAVDIKVVKKIRPKANSKAELIKIIKASKEAQLKNKADFNAKLEVVKSVAAQLPNGVTMSSQLRLNKVSVVRYINNK